VALSPPELLPGQGPGREAPEAPDPPEGEARRVPPTPLAYALIGLCVLAFGASARFPALHDAGVLYGPAVARGEWWRLLTTALLHGGPLHLVFNLSAVWTLGRWLERVLGTGRFALLTLVGTLGSSAAVLAANFTTPTLGISGVILAWAGFALPISDPSLRQQLRIWLLQVAALSLLPGISWAGHLGGFLAGLPVGLALRGGARRFDLVLPVVALAAAAVIAGALLIHR